MAARKIFIFLTIAIAVSYEIGYTANLNPDPVTLKTHYQAFIDQLISRCVYKETAMADSRLKSIRRAAALNCLKASYFKSHKDILIEKLISEEIGIKPYKIHHYLNKKFFTVLRIATSPGK